MDKAVGSLFTYDNNDSDNKQRNDDIISNHFIKQRILTTSMTVAKSPAAADSWIVLYNRVCLNASLLFSLEGSAE